jgi:hypothetical protein
MSTGTSAPIPLASFVAHRDTAQRISSFLAPDYTYAYVATNIQEARDVLAAIKAADASQRPKAWVIGGAMPREDVAELRQQVDVPVLMVPPGTYERVGGPNMAVYALGMLDGHFRQPQQL